MFIIYKNKYCNIRLHLISIIIVLSISLSLAENINDYASLNKKNGLYYKNFSNEPFTGSVLGAVEGYISKGLKEGKFTKKYKNGNILSIANFLNGNLQGEYVEYFNNGNILTERIYNNNKFLS